MDRYMTGAIKRRLKNLEHAVELEQAALMQELQDQIFEAMRIPNNDERLLDTIGERGEACTPEEEAALDRFSAEYERAYALVSSWQRAAETRRISFR